MDITLPAVAFVRDASNGPDLVVAQDRLALAFDDTTAEAVRSQPIIVPSAYKGGALKVDVQFNAAASGGNFGLHVAVEAITPEDAVNLQSAESFDSDNSGSVAVPGTAGYLGVLTITLTSKDSMAVGDYLRLRLTRNTSVSGDATGDVRVFAVRLYEEPA